MENEKFFINEGAPSKHINSVTLWRGQKDILNVKEEDTIVSVKGTVRGVKNRVRAGIATFLQDQNRKVTLKKLLNHFDLFHLIL